ncbi:putative nucleoporin NUP53 [Apostichopus japonicus]|uniref:Nucleoporin NUP53 n=1 Tax=Stichopus japonicus TaxID=307972 RepID=A0A2G8LLB8_STIJA|nr:putative nucleoporin NUP53 [Apostichopus japonicus]
MALGSPPQNQGLHQSFSHPAGQASGFLPGYLMGEPGHSVSPSSSRLWSASRSPSRGLAPSSLGPKDSTSRLERSDSFMSQRSGINASTKDHGNAPPVAGLYDHVDSPHHLGLTPHHVATPERKRLDSPAMNALSSSFSRQVSEATPRHSNHSRQSRSLGLIVASGQVLARPDDPFYTQGEFRESYFFNRCGLCQYVQEAIIPDTELDQTWVTIFGFPPSAASYILQQFSQYGNIQKHVQKALSKNGKIFGGNIMIGATPCIDKGVMEVGKENLYSSTLAENATSKRTVSFQEDGDYGKGNTSGP